MKYLLLMTFSGSSLYIGYLWWDKQFGKSMTQCMKYRALMVVMLAYVLPWIGLKETYKYIFIYLWRTEAVTAAKGWVSIADIRTEEVAYQTEGYRLWMLMLAIWFAFAILILIIRITRYLVRINSLVPWRLNVRTKIWKKQ